jgi:hypothetical protein
MVQPSIDLSYSTSDFIALLYGAFDLGGHVLPEIEKRLSTGFDGRDPMNNREAFFELRDDSGWLRLRKGAVERDFELPPLFTWTTDPEPQNTVWPDTKAELDGPVGEGGEICVESLTRFNADLPGFEGKLE